MRYFFLIAVLTLWSCSTPPAVVRTPQDVKPDIRERSDDSDQCAAMCQRLQDLKCAEGNPIYNSDLPGPSGVPNQTCTEFCIDIQAKGVRVAPSCVRNVADCSQVEVYREQCR